METSTLADHLDQRSEAILAVWRSTVERVGDVPEAEKLTEDEFLDHIPELLDRLADRLRGQPGEVLDSSKKHARIRWRQGYDIAEIVNEYGHLRTALTQATAQYARDSGWDISHLQAANEAINDVLDQATAESVRQFQEDSDSRARRALEELRKHQDAVEDAWVVAKVEQAKLRTVLDSLPTAVWVIDAEGVILGVNPEAARLQGYPRLEDVGPLNVKQLGPEYQIRYPDGASCPPESLPMARALRGETVVQEELVWAINGESRTLSINAAPLTDAAGSISGAVGVAQDITRRRRVEEELRHQLDFSRTITQTLGEGICTTDLDGCVTFMNPVAEELFGWSSAEMLGRNLHELAHHHRPDGSPYPIEECPLQRVVRTGERVRGDEFYIRKDGSLISLTFTASPIISNGRILGVAQVFRDITERRRLEANLAASEARFRSIVEKSPVMIWRADVDGWYDYFNQTWYDFRGRDLEQERREGWAEGVHPEDRERCLEIYRESFGRRDTFEMTYRLLRHDGQYRWISDRGTPYYDAGGTFLGFLGSCIDITERIELEEALEQQRELAEEASLHKSRLVSALSHDARTPLNAVVLAAQLLELHFNGNSDTEVQECLRTIRNSVRNVLDLLGDLLNLSKIDAGALPAEVSRFPLDLMLEECLSSIEPQARVKGLAVRLELGDLVGSSLETDRSKLKQILSNLLSNALRYTEAGHIRISCERSFDQVRIAVEDSGMGIAPSDQARIFDEFAMVDGPNRMSSGGTGLGLAICRRLASLLKGEITLRSTPDVGSTFTLILPSSVLTLSPPDLNVAAPFESPASGAILVAEDHLDSRQTLAKVLRRMGYRVLEAGNGRDALAILHQERPVAVLMDVNMPIMDGVDATLAIRADDRFRDLPIFALTGDVTLVNQHRIGEAGVNGYLEKPVTWEVLKQALATLEKRPKA